MVNRRADIKIKSSYWVFGPSRSVALGSLTPGPYPAYLSHPELLKHDRFAEAFGSFEKGTVHRTGLGPGELKEQAALGGRNAELEEAEEDQRKN